MTERRPVRADDLLAIKLVSDPDVSPDGSTAAFTVTQANRDDNDYKSAIWLVELQSGETSCLTSGKHRDSQPRWSPDGREIAFTSNRQDGDLKGQLWLMRANGGEPRRLSGLTEPVESFAWSPDGSRIAIVSKVREGEPNPDSDVRVITTPRFRFDGEGFLDDKYRQIFVLDVDSGEAAHVTDGPYEHRGVAWSPTGYELAFSGTRSDGWEFSSVVDIFVVRPEGGGIRRVTDQSGSFGSPSWSPDGTVLAFTGTQNLSTGFSRTEIFTVPARGGEPIPVTSEIDRAFTDGCIADVVSYPVHPPQWSSDGAHLVSVFNDEGSVRIGRVNLDGGLTPVTEPGRRVGGVRELAVGRLVYGGNDATSPGELFVSEADGSGERKLTSFNDDWLAEVQLSQPESFSAKSSDGSEVHGWIMRPVDFREDVKYPMLLEIHGGPFGMYGATMMHEFQMLAAKGYVVLYANPRGSTGYGDAFAEGLGHTWGEADLPDLMAAVDWAIDQGYVDEGRMGVLGGSYGGFMTNWVIGHVDRFKAAVTQRTISDLYSAYGTDDIFFSDNETTFGAVPWQDPERFYRLSPISYVENITTPLLILHSEEDYRCPIGQAEQLFIALKRLGREVEFVRFPDESHGLSRTGQPKHRLERLAYISGWFDRYL